LEGILVVFIQRLRRGLTGQVVLIPKHTRG